MIRIDALTKKVTKVHEKVMKNAIIGLVMTPDNKILYCADITGHLKSFWAKGCGCELRNYGKIFEKLRSIKITNSGKYLILAGEAKDGTGSL